MLTTVAHLLHRSWLYTRSFRGLHVMHCKRNCMRVIQLQIDVEGERASNCCLRVLMFTFVCEALRDPSCKAYSL